MDGKINEVERVDVGCGVEEMVLLGREGVQIVEKAGRGILMSMVNGEI